ncbi:unnamed protein product, partial [Discosporangium mesarthrocarpum]
MPFRTRTRWRVPREKKKKTTSTTNPLLLGVFQLSVTVRELEEIAREAAEQEAIREERKAMRNNPSIIPSRGEFFLHDNRYKDPPQAIPRAGAGARARGKGDGGLGSNGVNGGEA